MEYVIEFFQVREREGEGEGKEEEREEGEREAIVVCECERMALCVRKRMREEIYENFSLSPSLSLSLLTFSLPHSFHTQPLYRVRAIPMYRSRCIWTSAQSPHWEGVWTVCVTWLSTIGRAIKVHRKM